MRTRRVVAALLLLAVAVACRSRQDRSSNKQIAQMSQKLGIPVDTSGSGASGANGSTGDACSLLDSNEVAAAIGPLAAPPYHGTFKPDPDSPTCRYDTMNHRRLLVSVDWSGGAAAMKMINFGRSLTDAISKQGEEKMGTTVLASGDTLHGTWDRIAMGPMQCCDLHALRGDRHVELDWTGTRLSVQGAGALLDKAVGRLDHPLAISGAAGLAAAEQLYAADAKDSTVAMCTLVPQATAEALLGHPLAKAPEPGTAPGATGARECTYTTVLAAPGVIPQQYDLTLWEWRDGAVQFAEDQMAVGAATHAMRRQITGDTTTPPADTADYPLGPWDEAARSASPGYEAVKGAVMVKVAAFGNKQPALALLGGAVTALGAAH
mgnify:CR=1 FL=1